jgi:tRNA threonylcarbamoyl adenosine modification protein (Sua5/YciO/YrdC/YwlC family)
MDSDTIAKKLNADGVIGVIPTDTIYGVVARADDEAAVERLYKLKRRENKPGTLIAANIEQLESLGLKRRYLTAVEQYWPGAISVIIPCADPALAYLHRGKMSLAVRLPDDKDLRELLMQTGPLATSSANQPGEPPANTIEEAKKYFADHVDFYADGGDLSANQSSTIIRIVDDAIEIIREGAVKISESGREET